MIDFKKIKEEYNTLQTKLSQPGLSLNKKEYSEQSKRLALLQTIIEKINRIEEIKKEIKKNEEIISSEPDEELKKLAQEETLKLKKEEEEITRAIKTIWEELSSPKTETTSEVLVEIRAGVGGDEAALFAKDLFEMYQKFSQKMGWQLTVLACHPTELGGFKEISFEIKGKNVKEYLKYESGVHRVQRIPETEKMGRIHTSTVSVVVLEKPKEKEIQINPKDLKIEVYRASGPGGQYVNRRESAVRITHIPTGIVATSQSARTQISNRENALSILKARLYQKIKQEEEQKLGRERKKQIGSAMRAEKIRTYNFPQDRITDHRIKKSWNHIEQILNGDLDKIIKELRKNTNL